MGRLEIETTSFYFDFVVRPSEEKMKKLLNKSAISNLQNQYYLQPLNLKQSAYGPYLARELIMHFRDKLINKKKIWMKIFFVIIARGALTSYYKLTYNDGYEYRMVGKSFIETYIFVVSLFQNTLFFIQVI